MVIGNRGLTTRDNLSSGMTVAMSPSSDTTLRSINFQYFLCFAVYGALHPYLPVFLARQRDMDPMQIGLAWGSLSGAAVLMPVLTTLLADTQIAPRRLLLIIFAIGSATLFALLAVRSTAATLSLLAMHSLVYISIVPLQDGLYFSDHHERRRLEKPTPPYHRIRVWGTAGYILPSLVLWLVLADQAQVGLAIALGAVLCGIGAINSLFLPAPPSGESLRSEKLPTTAAARAMLQPDVLIYSVVMVLAGIAGAAHYNFFPLYLTDQLHLPHRWVGVIVNIGVAVELFFVLAFRWLIHRFGFKAVVAFGIMCMILRSTLLAWTPHVAVAAIAQALHGPVVLTLFLCPPIFLDRQAERRFRSSVQGLYAMSVSGSGRIVGSLLAGYLAQGGLLHLYWYATAIGIVALVVLVLAFRDHSDPTVEGSSSRGE